MLRAAEVLGAVADPEFPSALLAAGERCGSSEEETAWLTLGAAGARRARQVLAWRASQVLDPGQLVAVSAKSGAARKRGFRQRAAKSSEPGVAAAWRLLAHLRPGELRALVGARPALAALERRARTSRGSADARALRPALS